VSELSLKHQLRGILLGHMGRARAIKAEGLASRLGYFDDRLVRKVIKELIDEGLPVCSITEPPAGFFLASTREEAERYTKSLRKRAVLIFLRRKKVIRNAGLFVPAGQRRLL